MAVEVSTLNRYYRDFHAVRDVSFNVASGEIIGVLGLNGAGKSTILKMLAGLIPPSSGSIRVDGADIVADPTASHARIGYLPEDPPLYVDMTVEAFVRYIGRIKGMPPAEVEARLPLVLQTAQLADRRDQVIDTLSHGYRKRVGIAQAIIHDPKLIILDEPISGLDPVQIVEMRKVIRSLAAGRVVMVSSHILSEIEQTCDRIFVIRNGELVAQGTEEELTSKLLRNSIRVVVREDPRFEAWLRGQALVSAVTSFTVTSHGAEAVLELAGDVRERFAAELISADFGLRSLTNTQDALEQLFLGLNKTGVG